MNINKIYENLCIRDSRNPMYDELKDSYEPYDIMPEPRADCACDNCFYGRDRLALEIIRLRIKLGLYH